MRLCCYILVMLLFLPGALRAQIYHISRPLSNAEPEKEVKVTYKPRLEIYGDGIYSFGKIKDKNGDSLTNYMLGGRAGMRIGIGYHLMIGMEGEKLRATDQRTNALNRFRRSSWQGTLKWTFTPDTEPKLYMLLGIGKVKQDVHLSLMPSKQFVGDVLTWSAGIGGEAQIFAGLYISAEYRMNFDHHRGENFVFTEPRMRHELSAGVRYLF